MNGSLSGRVAVVTGGSSGIGREISLAFANEGANVVVADRQADPREGGRPTHEVIETKVGRDATFVKCDVTDVAALEDAVEAAASLGGIDVMVNNAGIFRHEDFLDVTPAAFDQLMAVNVRGVFFGSQVAAKRMVDADGGSIINLSSIAGLTGTGGYASYCTSKGAVRLLTYALADELGPEGIRVNAIHPGIIETTMTTDDVPIVGTEAGEGYEDQIPVGRFGTPEEVADAALYLASDQSSYVTGESLVVDGGMTNTG